MIPLDIFNVITATVVSASLLGFCVGFFLAVFRR